MVRRRDQARQREHPLPRRLHHGHLEDHRSRAHLAESHVKRRRDSFDRDRSVPSPDNVCDPIRRGRGSRQEHRRGRELEHAHDSAFHRSGLVDHLLHGQSRIRVYGGLRRQPGWDLRFSRLWEFLAPVRRRNSHSRLKRRSHPGWIYVSADYGNSWRLFAAGFGPNSLINYGLLAVDSLSVVASQIDGLWRLQYPASVHVTGPNGGEVLQAGSPHPISWTASNLLSLRIAFSTDNGSSWTTIADSIGPSQSPYNWTPPAIVSATCRVRITDDLVPFVSDQSDTNFTIYVNPLALHDPLGGERWSAGSTRTIDWLAYQIPTLRLEYSPDGGVD